MLSAEEDGELKYKGYLQGLLFLSQLFLRQMKKRRWRTNGVTAPSTL
jgi:hypothetical protein